MKACRLCQFAMMALFGIALVASATGCGSKSESKPNPEFTVPDIKPGNRDMPGVGGKKTTDNKDGKKG